MWAQRVREALKPLPELTGIEDELVSSQQITLDVDREAARRLGIEMATVTQALNNAFGQRQVSTIYNEMNQYRVVMEVAPRFAQGPESLDQVYVVTATGSRVPLSAFSRYTRTSANDRISRNDQFASENVSFELAPGRQPEPGTGGHQPRGGAAHAADLDPGTPAGQRQPVHAHAGQPGPCHPRHAADRRSSCSACSTRATSTR